MTMTSDAPTRPRDGSRHQGGPPLAIPALAFAVVSLAAVVVSIHTPHPDASAQAVLDYQRTHGSTLRVGGFLQFAAALPLAVWTATVVGRLRSLGVRAPGVNMALAGGLLASASLALGGLIAWTAAETASDTDRAVAAVLGRLGFATGGPGFVVPFALLIAGVAVPCLILGLLPRPVAVTGLVIAGAGMISTLTLLTLNLGPALPIGRFAGLAWLLTVTFLLPHKRTSRVVSATP
jgi:hypothetical protein